MKKLIVSIIVITMLILSFETTLAVEEKNSLETETGSEVMDMQNKAKTTLDKYKEVYGSESYGVTAFILNEVRIYSLPFCFMGIVVGALYQYILGTRRLDMKQKGFALIIAFLTILVICHVLPLIFAIVVKGWRG